MIVASLLSFGAAAARPGEAVNIRIGDVAILGYDLVAYFTASRAVKG
jgi:hypothetical protein